ncbi:hypothetical protein [Desulfofustis glycolicus]|uniref:Uncharacterized protein n=1 Tax=Desulfofustis glycolicus DSM 9705 TaxID=1121409 RepID=A0A1M5S3Y8_9BACT|nr:hypothetical protein [Desulfofustis glycolicus]SHH33204.1 hypothetical protein SAMN02745124_00150 [Desulfofustis glycolicus DSM 9705]
MAVFKKFQCTDGNAPVLSGTRGALISLLRACLIDGYGDVAPVQGWTLEFINATEDIAVFRNDPVDGTGAFLRIDEATPDAKSYIAKGYEIMTDIDNGSGLFYEAGASTYQNKSNFSNADSRQWHLFANNKMLHLFILPAAGIDVIPNMSLSTDFRIYSFGDFASYRAEPFPAFSCTSYPYSAYTYGLLPTNYNYSNAQTPRNYSLEANTPQLIYSVIAGPINLKWHELQKNAVPYNGNLLLCPVWFFDASPTYEKLRGRVEGVYIPCHHPESLSWQQVIQDGQKSYMLFPFSFRTTYNQINFAFEFEE